MVYHYSDLKNYQRCQRLYWLAKEESLPRNEYIRGDEHLISYVCEKMNIQNAFFGEKGDSTKKSLEACKNNNWLVNARFEHNGLRVKVPLLEKTKNQWNLYFISLGVYPKIEELSKCWVTWAVLNKNKIQCDQIKMIHLNKQYQREESLDVHQLLEISTNFYSAKRKSPKDMKKEILSKKWNLEEWIAKLDAVVEKPKAVLEGKCIKKKKCYFYDKCFPIKEIEDNSILTLTSSRYKREMFELGKTTLQEVDGEQLEGTKLQYAQIHADRKGGLHFDTIGIRGWLDSISYPISFLDFEWETFEVPPYRKMKPYDVLPFQYSLHILEEDGTLTHKEYLGTGDCRKELVEKLLADLPKVGTVMAFNTEAAEKLRLEEFKKVFPQYARQLRKIQKRMNDLSIPFMEGLVYDTRMQGGYSLKTLMGIMEEEPHYRDLTVNQAMAAVFHWRQLEKEKSEEKRQKLRLELLEYCGMDTYSMIVLYRWLHKQLEKELIKIEQQPNKRDHKEVTCVEYE